MSTLTPSPNETFGYFFSYAHLKHFSDTELSCFSPLLISISPYNLSFTLPFDILLLIVFR